MTTRITMTYSLAMAAAKDLADRTMRKAGREVWNDDDYNVMVDEFNRLYPLETHLEWMRSRK